MNQATLHSNLHMPKKTSKKSTAKSSSSFKLEKALTELEKLVEIMEQGDISLEDSLKHFEQGVELTRQCQKALKQAEQKVQILIDKSENADLQKFEEE